MVSYSKTIKMLESARKALQSIQNFDVYSVIQNEEAGPYGYDEAFEPTSRIVKMYQKLSINVLDELQYEQLKIIRDRAKFDYKEIVKLAKFRANDEKSKATRKIMVEDMKALYELSMDELHPFLTYWLYDVLGRYERNMGLGM